MSFWKCPGQDQSFWRPEDIFEFPCPHCGNSVEFWKNDVTRRCPNCKKQVANPRFDPGCAAWCSYAEKCLGEMAKVIKSQPQIIRSRLQAALRKKLTPEDRDLLNRSMKAAKKAEEMALSEKREPLIPLAVSLIGPAARAKGWSREEVLDLLEEAGIDDESTAFRIYQAIEAGDDAGNDHR
ncbi:hypothetical protein [Thermosediminibacter oceani]|uniref:Uncharacterized protein n=1 Tax=Thermosediminibacter oceani (strain ATCC BAA-1034 / DSM 16646 / JW/IW-1228P) TaxID=555079 RepID=D9RYR4_THEOJ|nr:hypothetical protein [Thermosediminibacter oceani]ADL08488.1 conserved hypothetical protein [Thermosediminibacter oceani DSM 16646]